MASALITLVLSFSSWAAPAADFSELQRLLVAQNEPLNCVNAGGSCNGKVPCCQDSYCIQNICRPYPMKGSEASGQLMACQGVTDVTRK